MGKKTSEEELNAWRYMHPSAIVSQRIVGDPTYAAHFMGEAQNLLYRVKNAMTFNKLGQHQDERRYSDGTVVRARSVFGQDFIEIDVSRRLRPSCLITLIDVPIEVPPMRWYAPGEETFTKNDDGVWEIRKPNGDLEVEGVDYIKTYYTVSVSSCPRCTPIDFTVGRNIHEIAASTAYQPFIYQSENDDGTLIYNYQGEMVPHFMGFPDSTPPVPEDPLNHLIYSLLGAGEAEIIKADVDDGGHYILWKAYTEWSNAAPEEVTFSRTGLGYMLMKGIIENNGIMLCESEGAIVKVDCCLKPEDDRQVRFWVPTAALICLPGAPFMFVDGRKYCEPPGTIGLYQLMWAAYAKEAVFWLFPDIFGGCIPFEWSISGPGSLLEAPGSHGVVVTFVPPDWWGQRFSCEQISITVQDRCGKEERVVTDCCGDPRWNLGTLSISYTALLMGFNTTQELIGGGGCPPYSWSMSGGGTLAASSSSDPASNNRMIYTGPSSNVDCAFNPTITLTDCCGNTASVSFAISNYSVLGAITNQTYESCGDCTTVGCVWWWRDMMYGCHWTRDTWDCAGNSLVSCEINPACGNIYAYSYNCLTLYTNCPQCMAGSDPPVACAAFRDADCESLPGSCVNPALGWGTTDIRTPAMKAAGCCPLNPFTGLPY